MALCPLPMSLDFWGEVHAFPVILRHLRLTIRFYLSSGSRSLHQTQFTGTLYTAYYILVQSLVNLG